MKWKSRLNKAWDFWKEYLHVLPVSYGKQIHHIWGRIGILKCCPLLMALLTPAQHQDPKVLKALRERTLILKQKVKENYERRGKCREILYRDTCEICPMRRDYEKKD